ncbi:immunoglobulin-like domain-containing protein [uncultured Aquimarina sp.]|uniref:immunoglobulin-like domain-containing protein n=1 Tax=uncultured Aquimarina sp. TaxID=575652 RepID=UPI0026021079|nr:immunoglobulin-like domain-containing protein [uncultured Aquimarina sp.]
MKKFYQYVVSGIVLLFIGIACTKEITDDLVVFFKVEFSDTTIETFVDTREASQFTITGGGDIAAGDYQIKYNVTEGAGSYFLNTVAIAENEFVDLPEGPEYTIEYVGTAVGTNKVTLTIKDQSNREEEFVLTYNVNDTDFIFNAEASPEAITYVNGEIDLNLNIEEISSATYNVQYVFETPDSDVLGTGRIVANGVEVNPETAIEVPVGDISWKFGGLTVGVVQFTLTATSSLGISKSNTIRIEVGETPDFTFTATTTEPTLATNTAADINFEIIETVGNSSYTMTYSSSQAGSFVYEDVIYQPGDEIPVVIGASTGQYTGTVMEDHDVEFVVANANTTPITKTSEVNLTFIDADTDAPVINLNGSDMLTLTVFDTYTETATATDDVDGNLTDQIVFGGDFVNTDALGTFTRTYNVTDASGNTATEVSRTINVVDDVIPVISVDSPSIDIGVGETFTETVSASDNFDGNITDQIVFGGTFVNTNSIGSFTRTYNVTDSSGNAAVEVTKTINVVDEVKPVILLNGPDSITLLVNDTYTETATASDNVDGNLTNSIVFGGTFTDTSAPGTFTRIYSVSDSSGNAADQVVRTIIVEAISTGPTWNLSTGLLTANPGDTVEIRVSSGGSTGYTIQVEARADSPSGALLGSLSAGTSNSSDSDLFVMPASGQVYIRGEHNSIGSGSTLTIAVEGVTVASENMGPSLPVPR